MIIRILGGGWYGCHLAKSLSADGHDVELHETGGRLFSGASGGNPARLHQGFHYPRSHVTRAQCLSNGFRFMREYGALTQGVLVNLYAVAAHDSLVDFGTYQHVMKDSAPFIPVHDPAEFGLANVEGAVLTGERHIVISRARDYFEKLLDGCALLKQQRCDDLDDARFDATIDCTFCAYDEEAIERFEPCVVGLLECAYEPDRAVTIMDGPFPSIYPWDEAEQLSSLSSAKFTPLSKTCKTYSEAEQVLAATSERDLLNRCYAMLNDMAEFWPSCRDIYALRGFRTSVRAMPRSAADSRLVDVIRVGKRALRVRAGKIDAVFTAAQRVDELLSEIVPLPRRLAHKRAHA